MVQLLKLKEEMFDDIFRSFLAEDNPRLNHRHWRLLFTVRNNQPEDYCGYVLVDGKDIFGMLRIIFSTR